jgi:cytochrome d ubiquinol oxidase subunit I
VAIGSNLSALWILIANSFMQQPVGFVLRNERAEMADFFALITNPNVWGQFPHVVAAGITTASFFILGISAYHLLRKSSDLELFRRSFQSAVIYGVIGTVLVILIGHTQAQHIVRIQPMKLAAAEALWDSENPASLSLFTVGNERDRRDVFAIRIPGLLSLLAYNRFTGEVQGINELQAEYVQKYGPGDYVPPVALTYWTFRFMVGAGLLMALIALYGLYLVMKGQFESKPRYLKLLIPAIALPYIANTSGWLMTELGRQPWIVYGLKKTADAVSPNVSTGTVLFSVVGFTLLYGVLMVADVYLLAKYAKNPETGKEATSSPAGAH